MNYLTALYGNQYEQLQKQSKPPEKGRLYGNLFLTAFIIVIIFTTILSINYIDSNLLRGIERSLRHIFGPADGKLIGRVFGIAIMAAVYPVVSLIFGRKSQYKRHASAFQAMDDKEKQKAVRTIIWPFMSVLGILFAFSILSLF